MRKLASVEIIDKLEPIPNADRILKATVKGWECVVSKSDNFQQGDKVVYIEVDSVLPARPEFAFLKDRKYRIKTIKLRKQISQGLILPLSYLPNKEYAVGEDVTKILNIKKFDPQLEAENKIMAVAAPKGRFTFLWKPLMRFRWFRRLYAKFHVQNEKFPTYIASKTDEERWQNITDKLEQWRDTNVPLICTEKIDGCHSYRSSVITNKGFLPIGKIVNEKLDVEVLTYNEESKCCEFKPIIDYHKILCTKPTYRIGVGSRGKGNKPKYIECTSNHEFLTQDGWKQADELTLDDTLNSVNTEVQDILPTKILSIEEFEAGHFGKHMYDLTIQDNHNYFVHSILTHNCSSTFFLDGGTFGVCSRNIWLRKEDNSPYWEIARRFQIEEALKEIQDCFGFRKIVLQGEIIGQNIQANKYKISGYDFYAYNLILDGIKVSQVKMEELLKEFRIKTVPVVYKHINVPSDLQTLNNLASGKSVLLDTQEREGIVCRNYEQGISFKAISPTFLLKEE